MSADLKTILEAVQKILDLEAQIETAVKSEKDLKRRARLLKALQERDLDEIRKMLFDL